MHYNGAFVACPDPVDFHAYMTADLYKQDNMFYLQGANKRVEQPAMRDYLGHTLISMRDNVAYEAALGDHGRSGEQFDIWQAVYSPTGEDGYPQPIFDKHTGAIDHRTADYWREHYDLDAILQRDWTTLGPKLQGKLHLYVGSDDTYFLNDAVYLMEDFLKQTGTPGHGVPYEGEVRYGPRAEHCWNGDPDEAELVLASALQPDVFAADHGAHSENGAARSRPDKLAILIAERAACFRGASKRSQRNHTFVAAPQTVRYPAIIGVCFPPLRRRPRRMVLL